MSNWFMSSMSTNLIKDPLALVMAAGRRGGDAAVYVDVAPIGLATIPDVAVEPGEHASAPATTMVPIAPATKLL